MVEKEKKLPSQASIWLPLNEADWASAPIIWLHSADPFMPSDILTHVQHMTPETNRKPIPGIPDLNLDNLALLNEYGNGVYLTSKDDVTASPSWIYGQAPDQTGAIRNATPCVVIVVEKSVRDVDA